MEARSQPGDRLAGGANGCGGLDRVAASLAASHPDAILAESTAGTRALRRATRAIPIVTYVADPVLSGFAASLRRPGGNVTGLCDFDAESATKAIEFLKRLVPRLSHIAVFFPGAVATSRESAGRYLAAAAKAGIEARLILLGNVNEFETTVRGVVRSGANGALSSGLLDDANLRKLGESARRNKLPTLTFLEPFKDTFPLTLQPYHRDWDGAFATIVDKVLRGTSPAEIAFEQPDALKVILNRRLAMDMGLAIPPEVEIQATEVIG